jgi:retron-type reverse transcriptase
MVYSNLFDEIISLENLFESWKEFRRGKRKKPDVQLFERYLEDNIFQLHSELKNKIYRHSEYTSFYITDPKRRHIHKACVKDRIIHHAVYRVLYPIFDKNFIYDSYSCRLRKGTHNAVKRLARFTRIVSKNYTNSCWVLKCDIKRFFASVDHEILFELIKKKIADRKVLWLVWEIISSFNSRERERE